MPKIKRVEVDGTRLSEAIRRRGYTFGQVADAVGMSDEYLSTCVTRNSIRQNVAELMALKLGIKYDEIKPLPPVETASTEDKPVETASTEGVDKIIARLDAMTASIDRLIEAIGATAEARYKAVFTPVYAALKSVQAEARDARQNERRIDGTIKRP